MKRRVTERGQVTIPKAIRARMGIRPGQEIEFTVEDGRLLLRPVTPRDPLDRLVGRIEEEVDVDAYLEETRGPPYDPRIDPEGTLDVDTE